MLLWGSASSDKGLIGICITRNLVKMKMNGVGFKNWVNKAKLYSPEVTLYLISPIINPSKYRKKTSV